MKRILWVDLEMTGLDPDEFVILEVAAIVTDLQLNPLAHYQSIVFQPPEELAKMNQWNVETHGQSGLLAQVPDGKALARVEREMIDFVKLHFGAEKPILAGNSIHQDRKFIDRYMAELSEILHYRMLDVSSFKQVFKFIYKKEFNKANTHRAFEDIRASIDELKYYLSFINIPR